MVTKTSGTVKIFDIDIDKDVAIAKSMLGVVSQEINFSQFEKVLDIVVTQAGFYGIPRSEGKKRAEQYLKKMQLWEKRKTDARSLSGGMKRRLMVARALVNRPKLLLLDEPTAGVDIETRRMMWDFLRDLNKKGTTIILTTHYLEEAEQLCNKVAIIDEGKIIENDSMQNVLKKLKTEVFILNTEEPLDEAPNIEGYLTNLRSPQEIEITVTQEQGVNDAFGSLQENGVKVLSMRNKNSRLEELFLDLTKGQLGDDS